MTTNSAQTLTLGTGEDGAVGISLKTLQTHFGCFGSSGSGKTVMSKVLVEELALNGIPVLAFDPQGDIASLALPADAKEIEKNGTDLSIHSEFSEKVEVVVWTPASSKGIPICINPLQFDDLDHLDKEERTRYFSAVAKNVVSLVGYDLDSEPGKQAEVVLSVLFEHAHSQDTKLHDFGDVVTNLQDIPEAVAKTISDVATRRFLGGLRKRLKRLTLGAESLMFQTGVPANIDALLGRDGSTEKTRISVIYLNSLQSEKEKEFFIAGITQLLYRWMLKHPLADGQEGVQCAMFIDEIAPYIPPVKVPACKESLDLLFRQGRKYGVSCMIATQSPGDVDYKSLGQIGTFVLGTLNTRQDIEKIRGRLEGVAKKKTDSFIKELPALNPGHFFVVSAKYENVVRVKSRWLVTQHRVIAEENLAELQPAGVREFYNRTASKDDHAAEKPVRVPLKSQTSEGDSIQTEAVELEIEVLDEQGEEAMVKPSVRRFRKKRRAEPEKVLIVSDRIKQRDLRRKIKPHLAGMLIKSEHLEQSRFRYLPLVKVDLTFIEEKGFIRKTQKKIAESLYLDYENKNLFYVRRQQFQFSQIVDNDPNDIEDLDDHCLMEEKPRNEVDFRFDRLKSSKLRKSTIKRIVERKYDVIVNNVELVLFPVWECTIKEDRSKKHHKITLDGVFGHPIPGI